MNQARPTSVTVIASLQIVLGILSLAMDGYDLLSGEAQPPDANDPGAVLGDQLERRLEADLPGYRTFGNLDVSASMGLSLLMIASGIGMLRLQPWARGAALLYVALSIACLVAETVYMVNYIAPAAKAFLEPHQAAADDKEKEAANELLVEASWGPYLNLLLMLYPALVLAVLLRPNVAAAFRGEAAGPGNVGDRPDGAGPPDAAPDDGFGPGR